MKAILASVGAVFVVALSTVAVAQQRPAVGQSPAAAALGRLNQGTPHLNVAVSPTGTGNLHFDAINRLGGTATVAPGTRTTFTAPQAVLDMNFGKGQPMGRTSPGVTVTRTSATTIAVTAQRPGVPVGPGAMPMRR